MKSDLGETKTYFEAIKKRMRNPLIRTIPQQGRVSLITSYCNLPTLGLSTQVQRVKSICFFSAMIGTPDFVFYYKTGRKLCQAFHRHHCEKMGFVV